MRLCNVVVVLNAMPIFAFFNKLVIFLIFGLWKNYQFVKKCEYRHSVQDYNNIAPSHKTTTTTPLQEHEKSGIYKTTRKTCHKAYVGQTSQTQNQDSENTYATLKTMTLARHMHYIYLTADMNVLTLTTL